MAAGAFDYLICRGAPLLVFFRLFLFLATSEYMGQFLYV